MSKATEQVKEQDGNHTCRVYGSRVHALYSFTDICNDPEVQVPQPLFYKRGNCPQGPGSSQIRLRDDWIWYSPRAAATELCGLMGRILPKDTQPEQHRAPRKPIVPDTGPDSHAARFIHLPFLARDCSSHI